MTCYVATRPTLAAAILGPAVIGFAVGFVCAWDVWLDQRLSEVPR